MRHKFTEEEDCFIKDQLPKVANIRELAEIFSKRFPNHPSNGNNMQKHLQKLGLKKSIWQKRERFKHIGSVNPIGTVIYDGKHGPRVKTDNGYVPAYRHFKTKYFPGQEGEMIHLNGKNDDFSRENLVIVSKFVYAMLHWRKWIFEDVELTKTAILTAQLLEFFPEYRHNENQYLRIRNAI